MRPFFSDQISHVASAKIDYLPSSQLERSRSPTPRSPTPPPPPFDHDDPQLIASDREVELKAHEALVSDNGRPCYPIKLGFKVFKDPAQYKDIFEYWQGERGMTYTLCRWIFHVQLERWEKFRQFQQKNRNEFGSCEKFAEFRQEILERRRRYGLDGDIQLLKEANEQKRMDEWMEYQDYELQKYEAYEKQLELFQKNLAAAHDELSKIRGSVLEDVPKLASGGFFTSAFSHNSENARIVKERELAERKLRIAEKRLEVAESIAPAESVKRATWVALFSETVDSKKLQVDESKRLVEIAENELKPLEVWFQSKRNEWIKERKENPEEAERNDGHAADSVEFRNQMKELNELEKKYSAAKLVRSRAEKGLAFAEECYKSTSLDNLGESINRADLINMMLEEIRPAKTRCEHSKESYKKVELDRRIPGLQHGIAVCQGMMKRHKILLDWVEGQRLEIFNEEDGVQQSKEATSKGPRKRSASGQSAPHESPKALSFQRTQPTTKSYHRLSQCRENYPGAKKKPEPVSKDQRAIRSVTGHRNGTC